jgi:hypothetical protein
MISTATTVTKPKAATRAKSTIAVDPLPNLVGERMIVKQQRSYKFPSKSARFYQVYQQPIRNSAEDANSILSLMNCFVNVVECG